MLRLLFVRVPHDHTRPEDQRISFVLALIAMVAVSAVFVHFIH